MARRADGARLAHNLPRGRTAYKQRRGSRQPALRKPRACAGSRLLPSRGLDAYIGSVLNFLMILWLGLLGANRIDFLAGSGPLILTPFLVLSPILIAGELWRTAGAGWQFRMPPFAAHFLMAVSALVALLLVSTFLSYDLPTSARRFVLLFAQIYLVFFIGIALANREAPEELLVRGAYTGIVICLLLSLGQLATWFAPALWPAALERVVSLEPRNYFGVIPRLTGSAIDSNHGGIFLVFCVALVLLFARPSRLRRWMLALALGLILLTLSRAALLAGLVLWGLATLKGRELRVGTTAIGTVTAVLAFITALFLLVPGALDPLVELSGIIGNRFTFSEGSTSQHALVLARGWEVGTESLKQALVGIGYGNAYVVLQDIFPGNEYGNFHSLFITFFAESGAPSALLALGIFAHVFMRAGPYRPLVGALFVYNLFQQAHTEPFLWLGLMLAWLGIGLVGDREGTPSDDGGSGRAHVRGEGRARNHPAIPTGAFQ